MTATLQFPAAVHASHAEPAGRWLQVVSHLDPKYGGLSSAVPALAGRIAQTRRFDVPLAAFCAPNEHFRPAEYEARNLTFWPTGRAAWLNNRQLHQSFSEELLRADGVHIHGLWEQSTAIAAKLARLHNKPYVLSAHGMLEPWALANKRLKKLIYAALVEHTNVARAACLHALTRAEASQYIHFGARSPIAIIPNGVDLPSTRDSSLFFQRFPQLQGKRILLFLSRLHAKKGLDLLVKSWANLANTWPDAHLVLAGPDSGGTQQNIERLVALHGLDHRILFTGMLDQPMKWSALAAAECFVLPSHSEGLSVSVLEAMGMGLPVIVTEQCNMPEVKDRRAGWQIQPDIDRLTTALTEFLQNTGSANREMGSRGADLIATQYNWTNIATQMANVYRWLQSGGPIPHNVELVFP